VVTSLVGINLVVIGLKCLVCSCLILLRGLLLVFVLPGQHPFLLADNRHYTFYIWRYVFRISPWIRYVAVPIYVFSIHVLVTELYTASALWSLFYIGCVLCTLIPSPLIEFRYYIIRMFCWVNSQHTIFTVYNC
jgi:alpha-1,2-glucosyltransferase